jgi:hypothetical protein
MLADDIAAFVAHRHSATFVALAAELPEHFADGTLDLTLEGENPSIVLWTTCSAEGIAAVRQAFKADRIGFAACSPLLYLGEGMRSFPLPMAEHAEHTERRWWPALIVAIT